MAKQGIFPARLATCEIPKCAACMFGKATRKPWRSKLPSTISVRYTPQRPGELTYIDQLISPTLGLIAQMTGRPTILRYQCATIFVDHVTDFTFIHLQKSTNAIETIEGKKEYEQFVREQGHKVQAYHADNDIFSCNEWRDSCNNSATRQRLTFSGVNAHHQNGVAERRIQEIQKSTRNSLIHANQRWPSAITNNLWMYAMCMVIGDMNNTPTSKSSDGRTPLHLLSNSMIQINLKHWFHFSAPAYVLQSALQAPPQIFHKWKPRSKVGIYLGHSKHHAQSVSLILSLEHYQAFGT